jgi:hypothetical protein
LTENVSVTKLSSNAGISVLMNCVFYDKWPFYEQCGPANVSDFAGQENDKTANIRYRGLSLTFDVFHLLNILIVAQELILPGGHSVPLQIILNNFRTILSK